jgi:imidazolonepropionase-like amidohydrolase
LGEPDPGSQHQETRQGSPAGNQQAIGSDQERRHLRPVGQKPVPMKPSAAETLLTDIEWLYTCSGSATFIRNAWIFVRDGIVVEMGTGDRPPPRSTNRVSLRNCLVTPGFINLHHHFYQSITRAVLGAEKSSVLGWLTTLYPVWAHLTDSDIAAATRQGSSRVGYPAASGGWRSSDPRRRS